MKKLIFAFLLAAALSVVNASAQSTNFNYQGVLKNAGVSTNGLFDFQFALFDAVESGVQLGPLQMLNNVPVANGIFAVNLDFGAVFTGPERYLEIRVRSAGGGAYTTLAPRQLITSSPYAVRALTAADAQTVGGVSPSEFVATTDSRLTDERLPLPGSTNYIQNSASQQSSSNFNISGTGSASTLNANQFNIGGNRMFWTNSGLDSVFVGLNSGLAPGGLENAFFGANAGKANSAGTDNVFVGYASGENNTGSQNSFVGALAGNRNIFGNNNTYVGLSAGFSNVGGESNSALGVGALQLGTTGTRNAAFGLFSGMRTSGSDNTFVGSLAGFANTTGSLNTALGKGADVSDIINNATAIGALSSVTQTNSLVLGSIFGINGAMADTNVGIGTTAPQYRLHVVGDNVRVENSSFPRFSINFSAGAANQKKWQNYATTNQLAFSALNDAETAENFWLLVNRGFGTTINSVAIPNGSLLVGYNSTGPTVDALSVDGTIGVTELGAAGTTQLCRNASNQISSCSSSLRYKTNVAPLSLGLGFLRQLRPISFDWKAGGMKDVGFGAEDVAKIDPRFVTFNDKGEVEGVKYDRVGVVLVNAVKEQQSEIDGQKAKIAAQGATIIRQQAEIERLKQAVCSIAPRTAVCAPTPKVRRPKSRR